MGITGRIVVLPTFGCYRCELYGLGSKRGVCSPREARCPLNALFEIKPFEEQLSGRYRESSFLEHRLVPESVKNRATAKVVCTGVEGADAAQDCNAKIGTKATLREVRETFAPLEETSVLHL